MVDISNLSVKELQDLNSMIPQAIERRRSEERGQVLKEVEAFARERGYTLADLMGRKGTRSGPRGKVKVKYRHPENASLTWTGRGKPKKWVSEWLASGKSLQDLAV